MLKSLKNNSLSYKSTFTNYIMHPSLKNSIEVIIRQRKRFNTMTPEKCKHSFHPYRGKYSLLKKSDFNRAVKNHVHFSNKPQNIKKILVHR